MIRRKTSPYFAGPAFRRPTQVLLACAIATGAACHGDDQPPPAATSLPAPAVAPESSLRLAPFQSSAVTLSGRLDAQPIAWTFERLSGELALRDGVPLRLSVGIDLGSVAASAAALKARLGRQDAFGAAAPATFRSTAISVLGGDRAAGFALAISGELRLGGRVHAVTLPARLTRAAGAWVMRGHATIAAPTWAAALAAPHREVFDDRLELQLRLTFPDVAARGLIAAARVPGARR
jgi:polyisoprenoid-binding protein YceI